MANSQLLYPRPLVNYYGINLNDSEHHLWEDFGVAKSKLTFKWKEIDALSFESFNDISIAVAQYYPTWSKVQVKSIANEIHISGKMEIYDSLIGLKENKLQKIGYIMAKEYLDDKTTTISISWLSIIENGPMDNEILPEAEQIQQIKSRKLKKLEKLLPVEFSKAYQDIPNPIIKTTEKQRYREYLSFDGEPLISKQDLIKFIEEPKVDGGGAIKIFYGTNRNKLEKTGVTDRYGEENDQLHVGFCDVQIPIGHEQGELERPFFNFFENEHIHVVVKEIQELQPADFNLQFNAMLNKSPEKHALIFIHGYRTTFEDAARRTAQLSWDIPFEGVSGFFSWPSEGKLIPYLTDDARARASVSKFAEFLEFVLDKKELEEVHIIAHSMGSLVLSLSIKEMKLNLVLKSKLDKVIQLIMGAPDIDQIEFRDIILPHFNAVGRQRTVYASDHDLALQVSSMGRSGLKRLGQSGDDIFCAKGIDLIEASNLRAADSHGYMFRHPAILGDIYFLITQGLPPRKRRLRLINLVNKQYWLFPK